MGEQKNEEEQMIQNDGYEASEVSDEMAEELAKEIPESTKEDIEEKESVEESVDYTPLPEKTKKHLKAKSLIQKAKKIVDEANKRAEECRLSLEAGLRSYEEAKSALHQGGLDACESLLKQLGYRSEMGETAKEAAAVEPKEALKPMEVKDISRGRFTGLFYALFGGIVVAIAMVYLASKKLEMRLDIGKLPSENEMDSILAWFSTIIGVQEDVAIGAGVLGSAVILVMILVYAVRVRWKTKCNLHFAVKQFVEAELYAEQKPDCKEAMEKMDAHIKDAIGTLKAYEVLLNEQKGKLQRILYFEGEKEKGAMYLDKSLLEIENTKELIRTIKDLIEIPIVEDERVSDKSILPLQKAKENIYTIMQRFY